MLIEPSRSIVTKRLSSSSSHRQIATLHPATSLARWNWLTSIWLWLLAPNSKHVLDSTFDGWRIFSSGWPRKMKNFFFNLRFVVYPMSFNPTFYVDFPIMSFVLLSNTRRQLCVDFFSVFPPNIFLLINNRAERAMQYSVLYIGSYRFCTNSLLLSINLHS